MSCWLIKYDPTGRQGAAGSDELIIDIPHTDTPLDTDCFIEGLKYIASAYSGVKIEYADVYRQINEGGQA